MPASSTSPYSCSMALTCFVCWNHSTRKTNNSKKTLVRNQQQIWHLINCSHSLEPTRQTKTREKKKKKKRNQRKKKKQSKQRRKIEKVEKRRYEPGT